MTGWMWIALGLVLAAIELATPGGFFIIFFGVGALVVGLLRVAGLFEPAWQQWLAFPIVALVALRLFRQPLLERLQSRDSGEVDSLVGDAALPASSLDPGGRGKAEVRGALWNARNVSERTVGARERCRVVAVNGLELDIRPE
jgi:membrane protein implicated in regulation of membrane protease activity